jgi:hypothetical protein
VAGDGGTEEAEMNEVFFACAAIVMFIVFMACVLSYDLSGLDKEERDGT